VFFARTIIYGDNIQTLPTPPAHHEDTTVSTSSESSKPHFETLRKHPKQTKNKHPAHRQRPDGTGGIELPPYDVTLTVYRRSIDEVDADKEMTVSEWSGFRAATRLTFFQTDRLRQFQKDQMAIVKGKRNVSRYQNRAYVGALSFLSLYPQSTHRGVYDLHLGIVYQTKEQKKFFTDPNEVGYLPPDYNFYTNNEYKKASEEKMYKLNTIHHDHASGHILLLTSKEENKKLKDPEECVRLVHFWYHLGVPFVPNPVI
jgi:hypothetical protein